jgi:hypothetical protein
VFELAAQLNKAVEIDGFPDRQDLDVNHLRIARSTEVRISLGADELHVIGKSAGLDQTSVGTRHDAVETLADNGVFG